MAPFQVTVHSLPTTQAFCLSDNTARSAIVFLHGLTSGPLCTPLANTLADKLPKDYAVWELRMRSSFTGFGFSSLAKDVADIAELVTYLREHKVDKVILLGTSTGCQDIMEYLSGKHNVPNVDGYILTCPVSDRQFGEFALGGGLKSSINKAKELLDQEMGDEIMPTGSLPPIFNSPVSAYRWHSLAANGGDDDYFSSDLDNISLANTFGKVDKPMLILTAGNDEMVPPTVNRKALLQMWRDNVHHGHLSNLSRSVPGANHQLSGKDMQDMCVDTILEFVQGLEA